MPTNVVNRLSAAGAGTTVDEPIDSSSFEIIDDDCLAHIILFLPMLAIGTSACVDRRLCNAVAVERTRRAKLYPWHFGATEVRRAGVCSGVGINIIRFMPDGSCLVGTGSTASQAEVTVYDRDLTVKSVLWNHSTRVFSVATDGKHHATGHTNGNIQLWDAATSSAVGELQHGKHYVHGLAIQADALVSGGSDSTAKYWSIASRECLATLRHKRNVNCVDINDTVVATASDDQTAQLWAHGSTTCKYVLNHDAEVNAVSLAAEVVATGCYDSLVRLFAVSNGQLLRTLRGHGGEVLSVCVRDGVVVSGAVDNAVRVWSMEEAEAPALVLKGHSTHVNGVALAPGASLIASMSSKEVLTWQPKVTSTASANAAPARSSTRLACKNVRCLRLGGCASCRARAENVRCAACRVLSAAGGVRR